MGVVVVEGSLVGSVEGGMGIPSSRSRASYFSILSGLAFLLAILSFWRMFSSSSSSALVRAALDSPSESWIEREQGEAWSGEGGSTSTTKDRSPFEELVMLKRPE